MSKTYLRRYTDLPALIYMLTQRRITLLNPQSWDDRNDSYYLSLYRKKKRIECVLALCFTQRGERYHHWRVFANGPSGVCIRFNRSELIQAVKKEAGVRTRGVTYLKLSEIRDTTPQTRDLPFLKRHQFKDEKEFRIIYESQTGLPKFDIPMPLSSIDRVTLSPWLHDDLAPHVKSMLKSIEGSSMLV